MFKRLVAFHRLLILFIFLLVRELMFNASTIFYYHCKFLLGLLRHLIVYDICVTCNFLFELLFFSIVFLYYKVDVIIIHEVVFFGFSMLTHQRLGGILALFFLTLGVSHYKDDDAILKWIYSSSSLLI